MEPLALKVCDEAARLILRCVERSFDRSTNTPSLLRTADYYVSISINPLTNVLILYPSDVF